MSVILAFLFAALLILAFVNRRKRGELPGPFTLPVIGNLGQIGWINWQRVWIPINFYAKIYGPIYSLYFGRRHVVVLSDPEVIKETMKKDEWNGRPKDTNATIKGDGNIMGIILTDGDLWKETRRFALRHLRDFGFGTAKMEAAILGEVKNLQSHIKSQVGENGGILKPANLFGPPVISTLWSMVAGSRCDFEDEKIIRLQSIVREVLRKRAIGQGIFWSFNSLRHLFPSWSGFDVQLRGFTQLKKHMRELVTEHKMTRCPESPRDFIDAYLDEKDRNPGNKNFYDEQLAVTCMDFFIAGSDTTTTTLQFSIMYLVNDGRIQEKVEREILSVVGLTRMISLEDKENLPYVEAFLTEVHRFASVAPIVTPHATTRDVQYKGFHIPKGSNVFMNNYGIHRNVERWGDPENFHPERFLSQEGKLLASDDWVLPFGYGKRRCPGENIARASMFLIFTNLIQKFVMEKVGDLDLEPVVGLNLNPKPFSIKFILRSSINNNDGNEE